MSSERICVEIPECNGVVHQGGNFGETVPVEMGQPSGKAPFFMYTKQAPDRMIIRNADNSIALETPCIGTEIVGNIAYECEQGGLDFRQTCVMDDGTKCFFFEGISNRTCLFTDGWTCHIDTGVCNHPFEWHGGSQITVEVEANCADTSDTYWSFEVGCP